MLRELTKSDWQAILSLPDEQIPEALLLRGTRNLKCQYDLHRGGQEPGESAIDALRREVLEECGLAIEVGKPIGVADEFVFAEDER